MIMQRQLFAVILASSSMLLAAQESGKAPEISGVRLGMKWAEAKEIIKPMFPLGDYTEGDFVLITESDTVSHQPSGVIYGAPRESFVLEYTVDGTVDYLYHKVRYYPRDSPQANTKVIHFFGHKKSDSQRTDLNLRPTLVTFLDTLNQKFGPPAQSSEMYHSYAWFMDDFFHMMNPSKLPSHCKDEPLIGVHTDGDASYGSFPTSPDTAWSDCKTGIWVRADTQQVDNQEIVTGYSIMVFDEAAAADDVEDRRASVPKAVPDNAHRPKF